MQLPANLHVSDSRDQNTRDCEWQGLCDEVAEGRVSNQDESDDMKSSCGVEDGSDGGCAPKKTL